MEEALGIALTLSTETLRMINKGLIIDRIDSTEEAAHYSGG